MPWTLQPRKGNRNPRYGKDDGYSKLGHAYTEVLSEEDMRDSPSTLVSVST
jgi:hypothetical protein